MQAQAQLAALPASCIPSGPEAGSIATTCAVAAQAKVVAPAGAGGREEQVGASGGIVAPQAVNPHLVAASSAAAAAGQSNNSSGAFLLLSPDACPLSKPIPATHVQPGAIVFNAECKGALPSLSGWALGHRSIGIDAVGKLKIPTATAAQAQAAGLASICTPAAAPVQAQAQPELAVLPASCIPSGPEAGSIATACTVAAQAKVVAPAGAAPGRSLLRRPLQDSFSQAKTQAGASSQGRMHGAEARAAVLEEQLASSATRDGSRLNFGPGGVS